jgi:hypothetical protein
MSEVLKLHAAGEPVNGNPFVLVDPGSEAETIWRSNGYLPEEEVAALRELQEKEAAEKEDAEVEAADKRVAKKTEPVETAQANAPPDPEPSAAPEPATAPRRGRPRKELKP